MNKIPFNIRKITSCAIRLSDLKHHKNLNESSKPSGSSMEDLENDATQILKPLSPSDFFQKIMYPWDIFKDMEDDQTRNFDIDDNTIRIPNKMLADEYLSSINLIISFEGASYIRIYYSIEMKGSEKMTSFLNYDIIGAPYHPACALQYDIDKNLNIQINQFSAWNKNLTCFDLLKLEHFIQAFFNSTSLIKSPLSTLFKDGTDLTRKYHLTNEVMLEMPRDNWADISDNIQKDFQKKYLTAVRELHKSILQEMKEKGDYLEMYNDMFVNENALLNESSKPGGSSMEDLEDDAERVIDVWVDLGLPSGLKWAKCNLGANSETDYGDYYMWGSTTPDTNKKCSWSTCPWGKDDPPMEILDAEHDAAQVAGLGRMPTKKDFGELIANTRKEWIENYDGSGVNGCLFISKINGNSIFFPASNFLDERPFKNLGDGGFIWSSSLHADNPADAWFFEVHGSVGFIHRCLGFTVRPVIDDSLKESSNTGGSTIEDLEDDAVEVTLPWQSKIQRKIKEIKAQIPKYKSPRKLTFLRIQLFLLQTTLEIATSGFQYGYYTHYLGRAKGDEPSLNLCLLCLNGYDDYEPDTQDFCYTENDKIDYSNRLNGKIEVGDSECMPFDSDTGEVWDTSLTIIHPKYACESDFYASDANWFTKNFYEMKKYKIADNGEYIDK